MSVSAKIGSLTAHSGHGVRPSATAESISPER
jgi:hypothetical protein